LISQAETPMSNRPQQTKKYAFNDSDAEALRKTFEDMLEEIHDLQAKLVDADNANLELYDDANQLEAQLIRLRQAYAEMDQALFDLTEDYVELEQEYRLIVEVDEQLLSNDEEIEDDGFVTYDTSKITFN